MKASKKLDDFIATQFMGWINTVDSPYYKFKDGSQNLRWAPYPVPPAWQNCDNHYFRPSTDIKAAWEVFDNLGCAWQISQADPGGYGPHQRWWCWLPEEYGGNGKVFKAETAPLAICMAARWQAKQEDR